MKPKTPPTKEETARAFVLWSARYAPYHADLHLEPFLHIKTSPMECGWLRQVRCALFLAPEQVAKKLGVSRSAYAAYELSEERKTITLATLEKAAAAMDCELIYAVRPLNRRRFIDMIWDRLLPSAMKHPWIKACHPARRAEALAGVARWTMNDPEFRKTQGWSKKANHPLRELAAFQLFQN